MEVSATFFKSIYDNKTNRNMKFKSFSQFEKLLYKLSEMPRKGKKDAELISPASYVDDTTRANKNVLDWSGWTAVDVDDHEFKGNLKDELYNRFGSFHYVCYSTASSSDNHPKFRLVFPIKAKIKSDKIRHFWFALNKELGEIGDGQTKDLSRMYYIPATYAGANNFIFSNSGVYIDPEQLISKHPYTEKRGSSFMDRLTPEMQAQVIEHRKNKMENTNFNWSGYRDCPFINKNHIKEWFAISGIDNSGRYAMIYKIMVSTAISAIKKEYPISSYEIEQLVRELDNETSRRYEKRPLNIEADRAIEYAYKNA
jgi:hypothetical protein